ncbi:hypothetical protein ACFE04_008206 [Oxalis oulophora]
METTQNSIKIVEVTQVSPSKSIHDYNTLHLTCFDLSFATLLPVDHLFFYEFSGSTSEIIHKLKCSLSLTLCYYRALAGHLTWGLSDSKPYVLCSQTDSVSVVIAESHADFYKLSSIDKIINAMELRSYAPSLQISDESATIISLQITSFPGFGFCIGITTHHAILDGKSTAILMKSWAYLCKNLCKENENYLLDLVLPAHLKPCLDRTLIKDPTGKREKLYLDWMLNSAAKINPEANPRSLKVVDTKPLKGVKEHVRATFHFSRQDINKVRENITSKLNFDDDLHLSSFSVTYAHAIVCYIKAKAVETNFRKVNFTFVSDHRSRLVPPLPVNYFGNCVAPSKLMIVEKKDVVGEEGHVNVVKNISDSIKSLKKYGYFESAEEVMNTFSKMEPSPLGVIAVAGSPKFELYEVDFGWGRPRKVDMETTKPSCICMIDSRDQSGGIEIGLVMENQAQLQAFASLFINEFIAFIGDVSRIIIELITNITLVVMEAHDGIDVIGVSRGLNEEQWLKGRW